MRAVSGYVVCECVLAFAIKRHESTTMQIIINARVRECVCYVYLRVCVGMWLHGVVNTLCHMRTMSELSAHAL